MRESSKDDRPTGGGHGQQGTRPRNAKSARVGGLAGCDDAASSVTSYIYFTTQDVSRQHHIALAAWLSA